MKSLKFLAVLLVVCACSALSLARPDEKHHDMKGDKNPQMDLLRSLEGSWEKPNSQNKDQMMVVSFHVIANKSVVLETMFPGTSEEMANTYHMDGDDLVMTHYCAEGVQPHMKMVSHDDKSIKFDFVNCSNMKDEKQGCMGALEIVVDGDKLTEKWFYRTAGKLGEPEVFEFHRKK